MDMDMDMDVLVTFEEVSMFHSHKQIPFSMCLDGAMLNGSFQRILPLKGSMHAKLLTR